MKGKVNYKPEGYHTITSYLIANDAHSLFSFIENAFSAEVISKNLMEDGSIMHADLKIGDSHIMLGQASGEWTPMQNSIFLYVEDCDKIYKQALDAGAKSVMEVADQFYGDRMGGVADASGNMWWIATHIEDVSPEEMKKREAEYVKEKSVAK